MHKTSERSMGDRLAQARRLKGVREWRDVLHAEIAAHAMTTAATVSRWEAGKAVPHPASLHLAARYLEVSEEWLRTGAGEPPASVAPNAPLPLVADTGEAPAPPVRHPREARRHAPEPMAHPRTGRVVDVTERHATRAPAKRKRG